MTEPSINISPAFQGALTYSDVLKTEATITFTLADPFNTTGGILWSIQHEDFIFSLSIKKNAVELKRNDSVLRFNFEEIKGPSAPISIFISWSPLQLAISVYVKGKIIGRNELATKPTPTPIELVRWARKTNLLNRDTYESEEDFRQRVYSCLTAINDKIYEANAFKSFWNISYEGQKIVGRKPKIEVDLQPLIQCMLSDQMLLSNIEIIPEYPTGAGSLDFLFIASVKNQGLVKLCTEFKLAHSKDLAHGFLRQLPAYMASSKAKYGAYCVLNFKGDWFDEPNIPDSSDVEFHVNRIAFDNNRTDLLSYIQIFIFEMAKPKTASKK